MEKHVVEAEELQAYLDGELEATRRAEVEKHANAKLTALAQKEVPATVRASPIVRHGAAWEEITTLAKERQVDLIIIGSHGYTGFKHMIMGSTAEKVVRYAGCPVLVVREYGKA